MGMVRWTVKADIAILHARFTKLSFGSSYHVTMGMVGRTVEADMEILRAKFTGIFLAVASM